MINKKLRIRSLLCAAAFTTVILTGCSAESVVREATGTEPVIAEDIPVTEENEAVADDGIITVKVESVDGNTVKAVSGYLEQQEMENDTLGGAPPEMPPEVKGNVESSGPAEGGAPDGDEALAARDGEMTDMAGTGTAPDGEPPEMPSGGAPEGEGMPEAPDGDNGMGGEAPASIPGGNAPGASLQFIAGDETVTFELADSTTVTVEFLEGSQEGTIESVVEGAVLEVTLDDNDVAEEVVVKNLNAGGGFGGSSTATNGTAANTISEDGDYSGETYSSSGDDENALRIDGAKVTIKSTDVEKSGGESSNTEDGDFYGQNAALLVLNGAEATITDATVNTDAVNGNGVFSYGEGTTVNISDSVIRTTKNNSGGIQTTGGGTMNATNLDSAAAIRSDRGGGTVTVMGGEYVTNGTGSPAIYSTADITVEDAVLTATSSEAVVVEGKNSVTLNNCIVTGNMAGTYGGTEETSGHIHNIMIYQSMSGDAEVGNATFSADGGSIVSENGDMFYVTNTNCTIGLSGVELILANDTLLSVEGNDASRGWGTAGANGGNVTFMADEQEMKGNIHVDEISSLSLTMENGTSFTGSINSGGQEGEVALVLDETSIWALTADSYIASFDGDIANVEAKGYTLYVNGEAVN